MTRQIAKYLSLFFALVVLAAFTMFIAAIWSDTPGLAENLGATGAIIGIPGGICLIVAMTYLHDHPS